MTAQGLFELCVCKLKIPLRHCNLAAESNSSWSCTYPMGVLSVLRACKCPLTSAWSVVSLGMSFATFVDI